MIIYVDLCRFMFIYVDLCRLHPFPTEIQNLCKFSIILRVVCQNVSKKQHPAKLLDVARHCSTFFDGLLDFARHGSTFFDGLLDMARHGSTLLDMARRCSQPKF